MGYKVIYYKGSTSPRTIHNSKNEILSVTSGKANIEGNKAGTFTFKIEATHPLYDEIVNRNGIIDVYQNEKIIFSGFVADVSVDFYKSKTFTCEGFYSQFNDTIQRPGTLTGSVGSIIESLLASHNSQIARSGTTSYLDKLKIRKGTFDGTITLRSYSLVTNMTPTIKCLQSIQKEFGGYMRVRRDASDGYLYLDYLTETIMPRNSQFVTIGTNLIDLNKKSSYDNVATNIIPLGAKISSPSVPDERLTIASVNSGLDYIATGLLVTNYGEIFKPVVFEGITDASELLSKARQYVTDAYGVNVCIEAKAFDMNIVSEDMSNFNLLDMVKVKSSYHEIDDYFPITKMSIDILDPSKNSITFGKEITQRISSQV